MFPNLTRREPTGAQVATDNPSSPHSFPNRKFLFKWLLGILVTISLGGYYSQGILNHIIFPAFSDKEHAVATLCLLGAVIAISGVSIYSCRRRGIEAGIRIGIEQETRRQQDLGEMPAIMEDLHKTLQDAEQK